MKLIESKVEYLPQGEGLEGIYKQIELAGRTCYHSCDKITEDSAKGFVDKMIKSHHLSMLEHGTVHLRFKDDTLNQHKLNSYHNNPYTEIMPEFDGSYWNMTTNLRVMKEDEWREDDMKNLCEPTKLHSKRYTFKFICSRAIANELVRHRKFSFAQESTRYVNYGKKEDIEFIKPSWAVLNTGKYRWNKSFIIGDGYIEDTQDSSAERILLRDMLQCEKSYNDMLSLGLKPQDARDILPLSLKTELCMTGFSSDWRYLLDLRLFGKTGKPHPDMVILMEKLKKVAEEAGIWDDIMRYPSRFKDEETS